MAMKRRSRIRLYVSGILRMRLPQKRGSGSAIVAFLLAVPLTVKTSQSRFLEL